MFPSPEKKAQRIFKNALLNASHHGSAVHHTANHLPVRWQRWGWQEHHPQQPDWQRGLVSRPGHDLPAECEATRWATSRLHGEDGQQREVFRKEIH